MGSGSGCGALPWRVGVETGDGASVAVASCWAGSSLQPPGLLGSGAYLGRPQSPASPYSYSLHTPLQPAQALHLAAALVVHRCPIAVSAGRGLSREKPQPSLVFLAAIAHQHRRSQLAISSLHPDTEPSPGASSRLVASLSPSRRRPIGTAASTSSRAPRPQSPTPVTTRVPRAPQPVVLRRPTTSSLDPWPLQHKRPAVPFALPIKQSNIN